MEDAIDPILLDRILICAKKDEAIEKLYLFGSRARGTATAFSDIDIAIICTSAADVNRAALNKAAIWYDGHVSFTYVLSHEFETDDHPLHVSSSIKKEGILLWQK
ncbi:MAG: nucleotidyltransferase domain-containing protein [Defluviitaleaceae bacterium]|nr:nucleotidyltransferase domain-containing protein [Defluviitaleaceae bacterium]